MQAERCPQPDDSYCSRAYANRADCLPLDEKRFHPAALAYGMEAALILLQLASCKQAGLKDLPQRFVQKLP